MQVAMLLLLPLSLGAEPIHIPLYGCMHDVSSVASWHPGGAAILRHVASLRLPDATALFESQHALRDAKEMKSKLAPYRHCPVHSEAHNDAPQQFTFADNGFYRTVRRRVAMSLQVNGDNRNTKGGLRAIAKSCAMCFTALGFLVASVRARRVVIATAYALVAGATAFTGLGFSLLHDASHHALFYRDSGSNDIASRFGATGIYWDHGSWQAHHVLGHHVFTGDAMLDPDLTHGVPYFCKMAHKEAYACDASLPATQYGLALGGLWLGQATHYYRSRAVGFRRAGVEPGLPALYRTIGPKPIRAEYLRQARRSSLFRQQGIVREPAAWWECLVALWIPVWLAAMLGTSLARSLPPVRARVQAMAALSPPDCRRTGFGHGDGEDDTELATDETYLLHGDHRRTDGGIACYQRHSLCLRWCDALGRCCACLLGLVLGLGLCYSINVLPNHDARRTHDSVANITCATDWGEVQLRGTANFGGPVWSWLFGGINYQIEHHLFPTIHHSYYPLIAPIVRAAAEEFNVPYTHFETVWHAMLEVLAQFRAAAQNAGGAGQASPAYLNLLREGLGLIPLRSS